jgi:PHD/YefM family antitoxin component YafN of YafNO toxin-antitoxin module
VKKYVARVKTNSAPIAVLDDGEPVGFFVGAEEFEKLQDKALRTFLKSRMKGATISHEEAFERIERKLRRRAGKA